MANAKDIQSHYDVSNDFFKLFLDEDYLAYSCAVWEPGSESLNLAQQAKIQRMCSYAGIKQGGTLLDVGCGWGGLMKYAVEQGGVRRASGITLSKAQKQYIESNAIRASKLD